jgi:alpha-beta hydrolase superfamily lysophospholipase
MTKFSFKNDKKAILFLGLLFLFTACLQEKLIFFPDKYAKDHVYSFTPKFKEYTFKVDRKVNLNGVLFESDSSKGLVFYLHGNGGSIDSWGSIADIYLKNNYDFFLLDFRAYGKSEGKIRNERTIHKDIQLVYDSLKTMYPENKIILIGYSLGTGLAAKLAVNNNPKALILKAPYYNLKDLTHSYYKHLPTCILRYHFKTNEFIPVIKCPITIFHGDVDETIYVGSAYKLQALFKAEDRLIILKNQKHNGMNSNPDYIRELKEILN